MKKVVNFIDSDKELVDKIKEYQKMLTLFK